MAEVHRAGIESIHWSQTAAARSLGLSQGRTMRFVVLPQAVRRVVPPLMNDFTGLALCYVVITFPMTRFTDRLLKRDQERMRAGGS